MMIKISVYSITLSVFLLIIINPLSIAEENPLPCSKHPKWDNWVEGDYLTTDWKGYRTKLEDKGITIEGSYTAEIFTKARGGLTNKFKGKYLGIIDTSLTLDTEKLGLWKGGTAYVSFQNTHGSGISTRYIGDIQLISSIDPEQNITHLNEYYIIQSFFKDILVFKAGKQDANDSFAYLENSEDFIQSSLTSPPNMPVPTYPLTGMGLATFITPHECFTFKYGLFDGNPNRSSFGLKTAFDGHDGAVHLFEGSFNSKIKSLKGNYIVGGWFHSGDHEEITTASFIRQFNHNYGFYAGIDQMLYKESTDKEDDQGLYLLGQYSYTPAKYSEISHYFGGALLYRGLIPHRNNDTSGIGVAIADISNRFKTLEGRGAETALEIFHKFQLTPWLIIQPDLQFIFSPDGIEKNAIAIGVRSIINF